MNERQLLRAPDGLTSSWDENAGRAVGGPAGAAARVLDA
jgi:hypothetical protein